MQRHDLGKREILVGYDDVLYGIRSSSRLRERERTKSRNLMEGLLACLPSPIQHYGSEPHDANDESAESSEYPVSRTNC